MCPVVIGHPYKQKCIIQGISGTKQQHLDLTVLSKLGLLLINWNCTTNASAGELFFLKIESPPNKSIDEHGYWEITNGHVIQSGYLSQIIFRWGKFISTSALMKKRSPEMFFSDQCPGVLTLACKLGKDIMVQRWATSARASKRRTAKHAPCSKMLNVCVVIYLKSRVSVSHIPAWVVGPALVYCWPTVYDAGPTVNQRWANVSCLLGWYTIIKWLHFCHVGLTFKNYFTSISAILPLEGRGP